MSVDIQDKINDFNEQSTCGQVDQVMSLAIEKMNQGIISQEDLEHLFTLYELAKNINTVQEIFISESTRLLNQKLSQEIEACRESNFPTPMQEEDVLNAASISEFPKFESYEDFIQSDFFKEYYDIGTGEIKGDWFWGIAERPQIKIVSFPWLDYELPEASWILKRWKWENGDMFYSILSSYSIPLELRDTMMNHALWPAPISPEERQVAINVQRMLIVLWYMNFDHFDASQDFWEWLELKETDISYYWVLGRNEWIAIKRFQQDIGFIESSDPEENQVDGIIWERTRPYIYRRIYDLFHNSN